ncbi:hypothetical protein VB715_21305 [Crocosphaera sp. UHCC 0190]|uniref:hypothetical protein n=1 Tax=Crocosphaera sp. UHCC 0190 TaxID=3110246 RepID=UPI002B209DC6|nr:hypothetical protein [Crocosphaera sp. UHCC 0190]MEA5512314.1 hypothetical protein [Crocosphaera sp. UHCC 0190]
MNTKLVESLAQVVKSLTSEERELFNAKVNSLNEAEERPFYETATTEEWIAAFREWAESHSHDSPMLSDEAISRESIYGERG